ncbi:MAG: tetratricopeptide repeat protein [Bacteriovoracia bacterium]
MKYAFVLSILLAGCAGGPSSKKALEADPAAGVVISNQDFAKKKPIVYTPGQDHYNAKGKGDNVLLSESANNASDAEMKEILAGKDPLAVMMASCYERDYQRAFGIAEAIFNTHLKLPTYWNQIATCYLLQGNERKALLFYNKAIEVSPDYVPALNNIGVIYGKNNQDQKAQVALQRALKNGQFTRTPRYNQAHLLLNYGLADKSLPIFQGLSNEAPNDVEVRIGLANSLAVLARWEEAWEHFSLVPDKLRRRSDVGLNMSLTAYRLGKKDLAKDLLSATDAEGLAKRYANELKRVIGD